jgi:hypothetical protein
MVFRHLGLTDESRGRIGLPRDLSVGNPAIESFVTWDPGPGGATAHLVDIGYLGSIEHIAWEGYYWSYQYHLLMPGTYDWPPEGTRPFLDPPGSSVLDNSDSGDDCTWLRQDYPAGSCDPEDLDGDGWDGDFQLWVRNGPDVGADARWNDGIEWYLGLNGVATRMAIAAGMTPDARYVHGRTSAGDVESLEHYGAIVAGFADHGIPLVVGIGRGSHFNTIIGYWDRGDEGFFVYAAEPLDGVDNSWKVPWTRQPMRWNRYELTEEVNRADLLGALLLFGHSDQGCGPHGWARAIDDAFGPDTLCGYL